MRRHSDESKSGDSTREVISFLAGEIESTHADPTIEMSTRRPCPDCGQQMLWYQTDCKACIRAKSKNR
jgi:predicted RNA-binding Zn-ribbon protein involved in translation (DUF1610 family)